MPLIMLESSHRPIIAEIAMTSISLVPRSALIFCSLARIPCDMSFLRSGYSVSSIPHSGGAIFLPQSGTASIDRNWSLASCSFKNSISPSERIMSLRIQVYHQPLSTLNTATNEDLSAMAVASVTAATFSPLL